MVTRPRNLQQADPYFDSVVLLCPFSGEDAATSASDLSNEGHTLTFNANAALDSDIRKYGFTSAAFDGTGDYISIPDSTTLSPESVSFTVECHVRFNGDPGTDQHTFVGKWNNPDVGNQKEWWVGYRNNKLNAFLSSNGTNGIFMADVVWDPAGDTWYHIAFVFDRELATNETRVYVDGTQVGTSDTTLNTYASFFNSTSQVWIGGYADDTNDWMDGWIENVRITKGVARYTSTFTPPERAYPTVQNVNGLILDSLQIYLDAGNTASYPGTGNTWTDLSGNSNDATYQATTAPFDSDGGGSFDFELSAASNDYFDIADDPSLEPGETWSLCFWVKTGDVTGQQYISNKHANDLAIICGYQANAINLYWDGYRPSAAATQMSNANDEWTHYAYTKDSNGLSDNVKGYKNGVELVSETVSYTIPDGASSYRLGATGTGAAYYKGKISVWMQYSRPLSAAEVLANFNAQKSRFGL